MAAGYFVVLRDLLQGMVCLTAFLVLFQPVWGYRGNEIARGAPYRVIDLLDSSYFAVQRSLCYHEISMLAALGLLVY